MKIVNGVGILNPKIAIVGEAPGAEEEIQGKPFVGRSGKLINKIMSELGINRDECYITNVVKFRPENNRTPTDKEIDQWRPLLFQELNTIQPKIIITLGAIATKALYGNFDFKITKLRGQLEFNDEISLYFYPTLHPSYCLRNPKETEKLIEDFKLALEFANG